MSEIISEADHSIDAKSDVGAKIVEQDVELSMDELDNVNGGLLATFALFFLVGAGAAGLYNKARGL